MTRVRAASRRREQIGRVAALSHGEATRCRAHAGYLALLSIGMRVALFFSQASRHEHVARQFKSYNIMNDPCTQYYLE